MRRIRISLMVLAGLFFLSVASQTFGQADVIKKRKQLMKSNNKQVKTIKKALVKKDFATIESSAKVIVGNMDKVLDLFPKGSTSEKSRVLEVHQTAVHSGPPFSYPWHSRRNSLASMTAAGVVVQTLRLSSGVALSDHSESPC